MAFGFLWWDLETDQAHFIKEMEEPEKVSQVGKKHVIPVLSTKN